MKNKTDSKDENSMQWFRLHFGIPSLDELIGGASSQVPRSIEDPSIRFNELGLILQKRKQRGSDYRKKDSPDETIQMGPAASSINIVGGDGSGKTLLALHLASAYCGDLLRFGGTETIKQSQIIYLSSDYSFERAEKAWFEFKLDQPLDRKIPFEASGTSTDMKSYKNGGGKETQLKVIFDELQPRSEEIAQFLAFPKESYDHSKNQKSIKFVDLATTNAGDDGSFINRLIGALPDLEDQDWPHLIIIDAVEGLETIVGDTDGHGIVSTRRSRIAQLLQLVAGKCHLCIVNELKDDNERLDEEFVTDAVIRLKYESRRNVSDRVVEVVKARSQASVRGTHVLSIRASGPGTPDDPQVGDKKSGFQSYIHCFHSLQARAKRLKEEDGLPKSYRRANFGIKYLDDLCGSKGQVGLTPGRMTLLLGGEATHKAKLARSFLAQCFVMDEKRDQEISKSNLNNEGCAIYFSTSMMTKQQAISRLMCHIGKVEDGLVQIKENDEKEISELFEKNLIFKPLSIDDLSSNVIVHIIEEHLHEAVAKFQNGNQKREIRVIFDDFATFYKTSKSLEEDPLLIPQIIRMISNVGATCVIACTTEANGSPTESSDEYQILRSLADRTVYTWNVPFFGSNRVAIATTPNFREDLRTSIRELKFKQTKFVSDLTKYLENPTAKEPRFEGFLDYKRGYAERLYVDPNFELYQGIEVGQPKLIPLEIILRNQNSRMTSYVADLEHYLSSDFVSEDGKSGLIHLIPSSDYEKHKQLVMRNFYRLNEKTTVLQVDEYWASDTSKGLLDMTDYHKAKCGPIPIEAGPLNDPANVFGRSNKRKLGKFDDPNGKAAFAVNEAEDPTDRSRVVPYYWDMTLILLKNNDWTNYLEKGDQREGQKYEVELVKKIYQNQTKDSTNGHGLAQGAQPSWRDFFRACQIVAMNSGRQYSSFPIPIFDVELGSSESVCSLVLEVFLSDIVSNNVENDWLKNFKTKSNSSTGLKSLAELVKEYPLQFMGALFLLYEVLDLTSLYSDKSLYEMGYRSASKEAVAVRHWYASACEFLTGEDLNAYSLRPTPGKFATRGDWFLSITSSSRSKLVGERAIDAFASRRSVSQRLNDGIGLPVRSLFETTDFDANKGQQSRNNQYLRTAIPGASRYGVNLLSYDQFLEQSGAKKIGEDSRFWLWRSNLMHYHRHSRVFAKWLIGTFRWMQTRAIEQDRKLTNGIRTYDRISLLFGQKVSLEGLKSRFQLNKDELKLDLNNMNVKVLKDDLNLHSPFSHSFGRPIEDLRKEIPECGDKLFRSLDSYVSFISGDVSAGTGTDSTAPGFDLLAELRHRLQFLVDDLDCSNVNVDDFKG